MVWKARGGIAWSSISVTFLSFFGYPVSCPHPLSTLVFCFSSLCLFDGIRCCCFFVCLFVFIYLFLFFFFFGFSRLVCFSFSFPFFVPLLAASAMHAARPAVASAARAATHAARPCTVHAANNTARVVAATARVANQQRFIRQVSQSDPIRAACSCSAAVNSHD